jgi:hypothetical protein
MKITRRQLRRIIREALEEENLYVVIGNAGRGRQTMWPEASKPGVYSKTEAEKIAKEQGSQSLAYGGSIHWHAQPLHQATEYVNPGQEASIGLADVLADYDSGGVWSEEQDFEAGFKR